MSALKLPAVVVVPRPPQARHNFELGKGGGGPPSLATAVPSHLAAGWPAQADLRAAASARRGSGRLRNEISALVCDVRVALAAAFLGGLPDNDGSSSQLAAEDAQDVAASRSVASRVYSDARTAASGLRPGAQISLALFRRPVARASGSLGVCCRACSGGWAGGGWSRSRLPALFSAT